MTELGKCECVSSVITIARVLNIDREKMGDMGILLIIDDGVYLYICTVYSSIFKEVTQNTFSYNIHLSTKEKI